MSAALARSCDRAVNTLRTLVVALVLLGLTATGALAGVFARQPAFGEEEAAGTEAPPANATKTGQRKLMVVHHPASGPTATSSALAGAPAAAVPAAPAPAPAPTPAPVVSAPPAPVESSGTSSGSDPG